MYKYTPKKYLATGLPILQEIPEDSILRPSAAKMSGTQCLSSRATLVSLFGDKTPQLGETENRVRGQNQ